jgi:hypothetical protein
MKAVHFATLAFGMAVAFVIGFLIGRPRPVPRPSAREIVQAQQFANKLLPPIWVRMFQEERWLKDLRQRGYEYCYRSGSIDAACASKQDEAVQSVFFALNISKAQQKMADQSRLSLREHEAARNPQLRTDIIRHCTGLYADHGKQDARLLAVCLGNLSEFSPLVPIPVP